MDLEKINQIINDYQVKYHEYYINREELIEKTFERIDEILSGHYGIIQFKAGYDAQSYFFHEKKIFFN